MCESGGMGVRHLRQTSGHLDHMEAGMGHVCHIEAESRPCVSGRGKAIWVILRQRVGHMETGDRPFGSY